MALIVETGTGDPTANSYVSLDYANTYNDQFNPDAGWADMDDTAKENALIIATRSVDTLYGIKFASMILSNAQALLWPRYAFYDLNNRLLNSGVIPNSLKSAVCELALNAVNGEETIVDPSQQNLIGSESIEVGPIKIATTYTGAGTTPTYASYGKVEALIKDLFINKVVVRISR